jgi:hypothetical protein
VPFVILVISSWSLSPSDIVFESSIVVPASSVLKPASHLNKVAVGVVSEEPSVTLKLNVCPGIPLDTEFVICRLPILFLSDITPHAVSGSVTAPLELAEFLPFCRVVAEPGSQLRAWGNILQPEVKRSLLFADSSWPKPFDKDSAAVARTCWFVDSLQFDHSGLPALSG